MNRYTRICVSKVLEIQPQSLLEVLDTLQLTNNLRMTLCAHGWKIEKAREGRKKKQDSPIRLFVWSLTRESIGQSGAFPLLCVMSVRLRSGLYAFSVLETKLLLVSKGRVLSINSFSSGPLPVVSMIFCQYKEESRSGMNVKTTLWRLQKVYRILLWQSE